MSISNSGDDVEVEFRQLTKAEKAPKASIGDALFGPNASPVEVKKASTTTINQVRAVKYITLVVKDTRTGKWYVVPAHEVVRLVSKKNRGQHTENPFESSTLSIRDLEKFVVQNEADLVQRVTDAIASADKFPTVKAAMDRILDDSKELAATALGAVRSLVAKELSN